LEVSQRMELTMKRFHVHLGVRSLEESTRFYSAVFGAEPTVRKADYAKWMLDDPCVNFAISKRGQSVGINHLGVQAETAEELENIHSNLERADRSIVAEKGVNCCYAKSDKYWITDPQGIAWESFRSLGSVPFYGEENPKAAACGTDQAGGCCVEQVDSRPATIPSGCCSPTPRVTLPARALRQASAEPPDS
jgi:catechol 2,3-dioxygenase-like lactoylglutathione lyase family enzyme